MKVAVTIFLAVSTALVGFYAAQLWLHSSKVCIVPAWAKYGGVEQADGESQTNSGWVAGIMEASEQAARLNQRAAIWTAFSVVLGAVTTITSAVLTLVH
ncbi:hypothetical protein PXJ20_16320 [Paraburkholderia sp. A1RI_3L]|uniref:hypothetical protein n=1 Tax=Paraburkholderia TaxID=1822464 RepID=UPI003B7B355F